MDMGNMRKKLKVVMGMKMDIKMEELIQIVAYLTDKYTSKESTSITYERASQLMEAVLYCIHEYEQQECHKEQLFKEGCLNGRMVYDRGYELVLEKMREAKDRYNQIITEFSSYGNRCYYDTFAIGIPSFFLSYDPRFEPQNHILTLDYPVLKSVDEFCGVDAVDLYIKNIGLEQLFLGKLPDEFIQHVLRACYPDYEELFFNLTGIVFRNLLGCRIAGKNADIRRYTHLEIERLKDFVNHNTVDSLEMNLCFFTDQLMDIGFNGDSKLAEYLKADLHNFSFELKNAGENGCLNVLLAL